MRPHSDGQGLAQDPDLRSNLFSAVCFGILALSQQLEIIMKPLCRSCAMAASFGFLCQADTQNPPLSIGCLSKQISYHSCFEGEVGDN